jgi:hypothetical protein
MRCGIRRFMASFVVLKSVAALVMLIGMMLVSMKASIRVHWMSYCGKLSWLSWRCFVQIQDIVAEAIRPLREASNDMGLGVFFGPCSPMLRISSPSLMEASIAAGRAAYKDKGVLSIGVHFEKMHNVALPDDGVEGSLVEDQSEAWIEPAGALSSVEVDVMTVVGMGPCDASVLESAVITKVQFYRLCLSFRSYVGNHLWCYRWSRDP